MTSNLSPPQSLQNRPSPLHRLSLVITAYNEEIALPKLFEELLEALGHWRALEVIIVNDGSRDQTAQVMSELKTTLRAHREAERYRKVRLTLCSLKKNLGMGAALRVGYSLASEDWVTFLPGDGQIEPSMVTRLCEAVEPRVSAVTTRYTNREYTWYRALLSRGLRHLSALIVGVSVTSEGSYLIKRDTLKQMPLASTSFMLNLEIPIRAAHRGLKLKVVDIEVRARQGGASSATELKRITSTFRDLVALRLRLMRGE